MTTASSDAQTQVKTVSGVLESGDLDCYGVSLIKGESFSAEVENGICQSEKFLPGSALE